MATHEEKVKKASIWAKRIFWFSIALGVAYVPADMIYKASKRKSAGDELSKHVPSATPSPAPKSEWVTVVAPASGETSETIRVSASIGSSWECYPEGKVTALVADGRSAEMVPSGGLVIPLPHGIKVNFRSEEGRNIAVRCKGMEKVTSY